MVNDKVIGSSKFRAISCPTSIGTAHFHIQENAFDFNASYQRDYVWTENEQQKFLNSIRLGFPVGHYAIIENDSFAEAKAYEWLEVVDGKQRLTTLKLFFNDEIPIIVDNESYLWSSLSLSEQRQFKSRHFPSYVFKNPESDLDILEFFYFINFGGVPQSDSHKQMIENKIKELK